MKKLIPVVALAFAAMACNTVDVDSTTPEMGSTTSLTLPVSISNPTSRVALAEGDSSDYLVTWKSDDQIALWVDGQTSTALEPFSISAYDDEVSTFEGSYDATLTGSARFVHPYSADMAVADGLVSIDLSEQVAADGLDHMGSTTYMVSDLFDVEAQDSTPSMQHLGSAIELVIEASAIEGYTLRSVEMSGSNGVSIPVSATFALASDDVVVTPTTYGAMTIDALECSATSNIYSIAVNAFPFDIAAEGSVTLALELEKDGVIYSSEAVATNSTGSTIAFERATKNTIKAVAGEATAGATTILASDFSTTNADTAIDATVGIYSFEWSVGSGSTKPAYYVSGEAIRMYMNNTVVISTTNGSALTQIAFNFYSSTYSNISDEVSSGVYDSETGIWTGNATSVTFTSVDDPDVSGNQQTRIVSIDITNAEANEETVAPEVEEEEEEEEDTTTQNTIAEAAVFANAGNTYNVSGTVVAKSTAGFIVSDATASIYVYGSASSYEIGDVVSISGATSTYSNAAQFSASAVTITKTGTETVVYPTPTVMSGSDFDSYVSNVSVQYVEYTGTLSISGSYYNVTVDGASYKPSISYPVDGMVDSSLNGETVTVTGYLTGYYGSYVYSVATSVVAAGDTEVEDEDEGLGADGAYIHADYFGVLTTEDLPDTTFGVYSFDWEAASHSSGLAPKYYTSTSTDNSMRIYLGNTLTISTTDGSALTSIEFVFVSESYDNLSSEDGAYDASTNTWSGNATSVTFIGINSEENSNNNSRVVSVSINGATEGDTTTEEDDTTTEEDDVVALNTIAEAAVFANAGNTYNVSGTVVAKSTAGFIVSDDTASIYVYGSASSYEIGDVVSISGATTTYSNAAQFTASSSTITKTGTETVVYPTPTVMSGSDFTSFVSNVSVQYVEYTGTLSISGSYYNVTVDGASYKPSISYPTTDMVDSSLDGATVTVTGYLTGYYSSYVYTVATSVVAAE